MSFQANINHVIDKTQDLIFHNDKDWHNWSGNQKFTPSKIFRPSSLRDIENIIKLAKENKKKIRCAASGHSWSSLSVTDGYLVLTKNLNKIEIKYNEKLRTWTVTTEVGK